jgi:phosphate-selective porin OprO/OprP
MDRLKRAFFKAALAGIILVPLLAMTGALSAQEASNNLPSYEESEPNTDPDGPDWRERIEQQLRRLEMRNDRLQKRYDQLSRQYKALKSQDNEGVFGAKGTNPDGKGIPNGVQFRPALAFLRDDSPGAESEKKGEGASAEKDPKPKKLFEELEEQGEEETEEPLVTPTPPARQRRQSGLGGAGQIIEDAPRQNMERYVDMLGTYQRNMRPPRVPASVSFREGLEIRSADDFITFEFHNLTQMDGRLFSNTGDALHDNFVIPRQRWYVQGQVTPYAYYYTVINRGYGPLDILDSWVDFNFAPRYKEKFQLRVGRMKTPYSYEYIKISESDLIAPERSLFIGNFAGNRQIGAMIHGQLFERQLEYFIGAFNGPRRSFQDYNNSKDIYTFLNFKPFLHSGLDWLEQLNISGSYNAGNEHNPLQPSFLTTANDQSPSANVENVSPTFLEFNSGAFENGMRMQWGGDLTYYYKSFTLTAGYQGGFQQYSFSTQTLATTKNFLLGTDAFVGFASTQRTTVPLEGWNVALTYFITGEEITRRVYLLEPKRPFGFYNGRLNPGAIELFSRVSNLQLGNQIFTDNLANPALWSNRATAVDTGVNWYLNNYVRIYIDWQHAMFGSPVFLGTNHFTKHENLYWFRTQVFF